MRQALVVLVVHLVQVAPLVPRDHLGQLDPLEQLGHLVQVDRPVPLVFLDPPGLVE